MVSFIILDELATGAQTYSDRLETYHEGTTKLVLAKRTLETGKGTNLLAGIEGKNQAERDARLETLVFEELAAVEFLEDEQAKARLGLEQAKLSWDLARYKVRTLEHWEGGLMAAFIPSNWVLADLFEVAALELLTPDYVLEGDQGLELVACPECDGEGWFECHGSAWGASCEAWDRPDLNFTLKPCTRCHCEGEVLDFIPTVLEPDVSFSLPYRLAA